ncbi:hypothetical protein AMJ39_01290 [candidate division TA06 bacterium DG_24]|jgi:3-oxoacyl-[acyl-carrier protein] reductase|uniref:3-oxoacyl-[acyl-carrier-protein] reductase n=2 Tax=Bacteria division TA06 TaxID=1156500 RepID=A0A0S8JPV6_UNCT6|nr:MAG: hypothetical protein AMJ39_01290 [candidate division TA06 bacterium DG_24]KPL11490.1 MAG: hypothetical protein AMJ71_00840 [candidate division TA06 bacterium SM1_40]
MTIQDRRALVTGGAQGIGRAIALRLARDGASIVIWDIDEDALEAVKSDVEGEGRACHVARVDITDSAAVEANVKEVLDRLGPIDILVNNAGIVRDSLMVRMKDADWDAVLAVNLKGAFLCSRAVARSMMKRRSGVILNIASVVGVIGNAGQVNYAASKAGLIGLTKSIARELASRGVRVNAIAPGFIDTAMTSGLTKEVRENLLRGIPLGRLGMAEDVANVAAFLVSDDASYVTGQVFHVDGGMVM